jgi:hypothetical protein
MKSRLLTAGAAMAGILLGCPWPASAHRLDEYLQAARFSVQRDSVVVEIDLTAGVSVAPLVSSLIDTNHDGRISEAEGQEYAAEVLRSIELYVDKNLVPLTLAGESFPDLDAMNEGTGMIRLRGTAKYTPLTVGRHKLFYRNMHQPGISVYLANALVPEDKQIEITAQGRDTAQQELTIEYRVVPAPQRLQSWLSALLAFAGIVLPLSAVLAYRRQLKSIFSGPEGRKTLAHGVSRG